MRVGVIGGGQLARMMIPPAVALGIELRVLAEQAGGSAALAATSVGDYRDTETVLAFARDVDVVTFDHEHVPQAVLAALVDDRRGDPTRGRTRSRSPRTSCSCGSGSTRAGIPVPDWAPVRDRAELEAFLRDHGGVAVVKTPRGGYDGKGVRIVRSADAVDDWFAVLDEHASGSALLAEEWVGFRRELAQSVARRPSGELAAWPLVETVQRDGVCAEVFAPGAGRRSAGPARAGAGRGRRRTTRRDGRARRRAVRDGGRAPARQRARDAPAQHRPLDDRRLVSRASSSSTCAPCSTSRSARPSCSPRGA